MTRHLMAMGMTDAYDAGKADFSGITDAGIFVDFVKMFIGCVTDPR